MIAGRDVAGEHGQHVLDAQRHGLLQRRQVILVPQERLIRQTLCHGPNSP